MHLHVAGLGEKHGWPRDHIAFGRKEGRKQVFLKFMTLETDS